MGIVSLEHGKAAYWADFALHGAAVALLVLLPAWWRLQPWAAEALSLGVVSGYLAYGLMHHAMHHARMPTAWLQRRKRWHALHHHRQGGRCYGVTTGFWDRRFGSGPAR